MIDKIFLILIFGVSFANFLFYKVDLWHAQATWVQLGIIVLYFLHLFKKSKPLACLFLWASILTSFYWFTTFQTTKRYPIGLLLPYFNFLCIVILFDIITKYVKRETYEKAIKYLPICLGIVLVYAILQKLNLDQFYNYFCNTVVAFKYDSVVGTIANPMHFSHYICILLPCLFLLKEPLNKLGILFALIIILLTGSASGLFIALLIILFYSIFFKIFNRKEMLLCSLAVILLIICKYKTFFGILHNYTFDSGRFAIWKEYIPIFQKKPITGWGFGIVNAYASKMSQIGWRHLHNEYYHFAVELGLIGLGLILWGIWDYFKRFSIIVKDKTNVVMVSMFLAFCLTSLFGYPSHLYMLALFGLISYSFLYLEA